MNKTLLILILVLFPITANAIDIQKSTVNVVVVNGVPSFCFSGVVYINSLTADIYSLKAGIGCKLSGNTASITGTGINGRIAYWNGTNTLANSINLLFDGTSITSTFIGNLTGNVTGTASLNELLSNKSTSTSLGTSNTLYPTQNAVKSYVDTQISGISVPVTSVFSRTGAVTAQSGDYSVGQITNAANILSGLNQFASTTSAQLRGVLSDESGTGVAFFQSGNIGAATGTSLSLTGNFTFGTSSTGNQLQSISGVAAFLDTGGTTFAKAKANDFAANWLHTYSDVTTDSGRNWITGISNRMTMLSTFTMGWVSSTTDAFGAPDTAFARNSAGVVGITNTIAPVTNAAGDLGTTSLGWRQLYLDKTITATGTTGAQTINKVQFSVNFAATNTSLVVTNSLIATTTSIVCTVNTNDTTLKSVQAVPASGSVTLFGNAAATAETRVSCLVFN